MQPVNTLGLLATLASQADEIVGRVISIADGDTIAVLDASNTQHKIRLAGIDAPERGPVLIECAAIAIRRSARLRRSTLLQVDSELEPVFFKQA